MTEKDGYCKIHRDSDSVDIRKMDILPEHRRVGLGKALMEMLEAAINLVVIKCLHKDC